jgi:trimeric autotransporter adhesin
MKRPGMLVASVLAIAVSVTHAQIPRTLSYQGLLTDSSGATVPDGSYGLVFRLYQTSTGGSSLWQETRTLQTHRGVFAANLGEVTPLTLPFDRPYWLGIQLGADPELTPRMELSSSAYSLNSMRADSSRSVQRPLSTPITNAELANRSVTLSKIDTAGAQNNQVITFNGGSVVWGMPSSGGLSLPYSGTANAYNPFSLTNQSTGDYSRAIEGVSTATSGATYGVGGVTNSLSDNAIGTFGLATGSTGMNSGVYGATYSQTTGAKGVFGSAEGSTGETYGVFGQTKSSTGGSNGVTGNALALSGVTNGVYGSTMSSTNGASGLFGFAPATSGMTYGVYGRTQSLSDFTAGVNGYAARTSGISYGVYGASNSGSDGAAGVYGSADRSTGAVYGVYGTTNSSGNGAIGVYGSSSSATGITAGVAGLTLSSSGIGVEGYATRQTGTNTGVLGRSDSPDGKGVYGIGVGLGVVGESSSPNGWGVYGLATAAATGSSAKGVIGIVNGTISTSIDPVCGVCGEATGNAFGVYAYSPGLWALFADGQFAATGYKSFFIDHPMDPANKFLTHYCSEGPEALDVYSGNVTLDVKGEAWVDLPPYFEALNRDFRYQLTPIGKPAPNLNIAEEIQGNRFKIAGGAPDAKISWRVEGVRNDRWAQTHPASVETDKPAALRGKFLRPELYGQSTEQGIFSHAAPEGVSAHPSVGSNVLRLPTSPTIRSEQPAAPAKEDHQ